MRSQVKVTGQRKVIKLLVYYLYITCGYFTHSRALYYNIDHFSVSVSYINKDTCKI